MNLFKSIFYSTAMALFMSYFPVYAENLVTFGIDKEIYLKMNEDQTNKLLQRIQELNTFVEENVKPKLPKEIINRPDFKINISLSDKPGRDGLFVPRESDHEHKITIQLVQVYSNGAKALIAHEIFHAIHFEMNPDEATWIREGMAQVFEYMTTGELNGRNMAAAIQNPLTPLLGSYDVENNNPAQYGHNQFYFYYLYSHCGKEALFWKLASGNNNSGERGSYLIDSVLSEMKSTKPQCKDFTESAVLFEVAKVHNQIQYQNTQGRETFFLYPSLITPQFAKINSAQELKQAIFQLPVLSSYRISLKLYEEQKGECKNCAVFFAENIFPYQVTEVRPTSPGSYDVILVKLRKN